MAKIRGKILAQISIYVKKLTFRNCCWHITVHEILQDARYNQDRKFLYPAYCQVHIYNMNEIYLLLSLNRRLMIMSYHLATRRSLRRQKSSLSSRWTRSPERKRQIFRYSILFRTLSLNYGFSNDYSQSMISGLFCELANLQGAEENSLSCEVREQFKNQVRGVAENCHLSLFSNQGKMKEKVSPNHFSA